VRRGPEKKKRRWSKGKNKATKTRIKKKKKLFQIRGRCVSGRERFAPKGEKRMGGASSEPKGNPSFN